MSFITSKWMSLTGAVSPVCTSKTDECTKQLASDLAIQSQSFFDHLDDAAFVVEHFNFIIGANSAFAALVEIAVESLAGRSLSSLHLSFYDPAGGAVSPLSYENASSVVSMGVCSSDGVERFRYSVSVMRLRHGVERVLIVVGDRIDTATREKRGVQSLEELQKAQDELVAQFDALREMSMRDALTGVLNRRSLRDRIEEQSQVVNLERNSVLMIDIDHFKKLNDRHGHPVGDEVLCSVANLIVSCVGYLGSVYRYGGEEFCVVMPKALGSEAFVLANEVCERVQGRLKHPYGITVSIGVSEDAAECRSISQLIHEADSSLLFAKRSGRNCAKQWSMDLQPSSFKGDGTCSIEVGLDEQPVSFHAICALNSALGMNDILSAVHSHRVADISGPLARMLLTERQSHRLELASIVHEYGRIGTKQTEEHRVPRQEIVKYLCSDLHSRRRLEVCKKTLRVLESVVTDEVVLRTLRFHPQLYSCDGVAAPDPNVPIESRILALSDTYDDLRNGRISIAFTHEEAMTVLHNCKGKLLAPEIVDMFASTQMGWRPAACVTLDEYSGRDVLAVGYILESILHSFEIRNVERLRVDLQALNRIAMRLEMRFMSTVACDFSEALDRHAEGDWNSLSDSLGALIELCASIQRPFLRCRLY